MNYRNNFESRAHRDIIVTGKRKWGHGNLKLFGK